VRRLLLGGGRSHGLFDEVRHGGRLRYVNGVTCRHLDYGRLKPGWTWCAGPPGDHSASRDGSAAHADILIKALMVFGPRPVLDACRAAYSAEVLRGQPECCADR
jgi:hypothetical protein